MKKWHGQRGKQIIKTVGILLFIFSLIIIPNLQLFAEIFEQFQTEKIVDEVEELLDDELSDDKGMDAAKSSAIIKGQVISSDSGIGINGMIVVLEKKVEGEWMHQQMISSAGVEAGYLEEGWFEFEYLEAGCYRLLLDMNPMKEEAYEVNENSSALEEFEIDGENEIEVVFQLERKAVDNEADDDSTQDNGEKSTYSEQLPQMQAATEEIDDDMIKIDLSTSETDTGYTVSSNLVTLNPVNPEGDTYSYYIYQSSNASSTEKYIVVKPDGDNFIDIEIDGLNISLENSPFSIESGANVHLTVSGTNSLLCSSTTKLSNSKAGIQLLENSELIIDGTGSVTARGGPYAAGIGSNNLGNVRHSTGRITIQGDVEITATSGIYGTGIGGGWKGDAPYIAIRGGTIYAEAGSGEAAGAGSGIGSGVYGNAEEIIITGGIVSAKGGSVTESGTNDKDHGGRYRGGGAGIGSGAWSNYANITVSGGVVTATGGYNPKVKGTGYGGAGIGTGSGGTESLTKGSLATVDIEGDAQIYATGGSFGAGIGGGTWGGAKVTIIGHPQVNATGGNNAAGIGGGMGSSRANNRPEVYISGEPIIYAQGGGGTVIDYWCTAGAGIGGGRETDALIDIGGGTITATGGNITGTNLGGAGIGGGSGLNQGTVASGGGSGDIHIHGSAQITAQGGRGASGIGGGFFASGGSIRISDTPVIEAMGGIWGAGIGNGNNYRSGTTSGSPGSITITGGTIRAAGGQTTTYGGGAGIGGGMNSDSGTILIEGEDTIIYAKGGYSAAGIGGGTRGPGKSITISAGTVTALAGDYYFGYGGAGIGGGGGGEKRRGHQGGAGGVITINGTAEVYAQSFAHAAGIGGGRGSSQGSTGGVITLGGKAAVTAVAHGTGAGIGGSYLGSGGSIVITDEARVFAQGGDWGAGAGIGGGHGGTAGEIVIISGTVEAVSGMTVVKNASYKEAGAAIGAGSHTAASAAGKIDIYKEAAVQAYVLVPNAPTTNMISKGIYAIQDIRNTNGASVTQKGDAYVVNVYFEEALNVKGDTVIKIKDPATQAELDEILIPQGCYSYAYTTPGLREEHHYAYNTRTNTETALYVKDEDNLPEVTSNGINFKGVLLRNMKDTIEGTLWRDNNANGVFDENEQGIEGRTVKLHHKSGNGWVDTGRTVRTDGKGFYRFYVNEGTYMVEFPEIDQHTFTVRAEETVDYPYTNTSVAGRDSGISSEYRYSYEIKITGTKDIDKAQREIANAGYLGPVVDSNLKFKKTVYDEETGDWVDTLEIARTSKKYLTYRLEFRMPTNTEGYRNLSLHDILAAELDLDLASGNWQDAVRLYGMPSEAKDKYNFKFNSSERAVICEFLPDETNAENPYNYLSGQILMLEVDTILSASANSNHRVENYGELVINEGYGNPLIITQDEYYNDVKATVQMTGTLTGVAFMDHSGDGLYTSGGVDTKEAGVLVELYDKRGTLIDSMVTDKYGFYEFKVALDEGYYIEAPMSWNLSDLLIKRSGGSDIHKTTGRSDILQADYNNWQIEANIGYEGAELAPPEFTHQIVDNSGNSAVYHQELTLIDDPAEPITYKLTIKLPDKKEDLAFYESIMIEDLLDIHLKIVEEPKVVFGTMTETQIEKFTSLTYDDESHKIFFHINGEVNDDGDVVNYYDISQQAGETIEITIVMQVDDEKTNYAHDAMINKAKLTVNSGSMYPKEGDPEVFVKGAITGKIFDEIYSKELAGVEVWLYEDTSYGAIPIRSVKSNSNGEYRFEAELDTDYLIGVPTVLSSTYKYAGLINRGKAEELEASHASVVTGYSYGIHIDDYDDKLARVENRKAGSRFGLANAGYAEPDVSKVDFKKQIWDERIQDYTDTGITVTDKDEVLEYLMSFAMPEDTRGYQSIILQDILPEGLVLATGGLTDDVTVSILHTAEDGTISITEAPVNGQTLIQNGAQILYYFPNTFDFASIAKAEVQMTVKVKLDPARTDFKKQIPLTNAGQLIINGDIQKILETGIELKGSITGTIFEDKDPNRNGLYDAGEELQELYTVVLYQTDGAGNIITPNVDTDTTSTGKYHFEGLEIGKSYIIEFQPVWDGTNSYRGLVTKGSEKNKAASHVNIQTGLTEEITITDVSPYVRNAGYAEPDTDSIAMYKELLDAEYDKDRNVVLTDTTGTMTFRIRAQLPADLYGYQSITLEDVLPAELVPADTAHPENCVTVKAYEGLNTMEVKGTTTYTGGTLRFEVSDIEKLLAFGNGKKVTLVMEVEAAFKAGISNYPSRLKNIGQLIVNGNAGDKKEVVLDLYMGGEVTGFVFEDLDDTNTYTQGDLLKPKVKVELWKDGRRYDETVTDSDGKYRFVVSECGKYQVKFPEQIGYAQLVEKEAGADDTTNSHAEPTTGETALREILNEDGKRNISFNAGYVEAERYGREFIKVLVDEKGASVQSLDVTDLSKPVHYMLQVTLPTDLEDYESAGLLDILPDELELSGAAEDYVRIEIGDIPDAEVFDYGTLSYDNGVVTFTFHKEKLKELAGKTVTMYVETAFVDQEEPPAEPIVNQAQLKLGDKIIEPDGENPGIEVKGLIEGIVFLDDTSAIPPGSPLMVKVELFKLDEHGVPKSLGYQGVELGDTYQFVVDIEPKGSLEETYYVRFSLQVSTAGLITKGTGSPHISHADETTGFSDGMHVTANPGGSRVHTANAGYAVPDIDPGELNLKKLVRTEDGKYEEDITIEDLEQSLIYQISFQVPDEAGPIKSIEIMDKLPAELELEVSLARSVQVLLGSGAEERNITSYGVLTENEGKISWYFEQNSFLNFEELKGQTVHMEVRTKIREGITEEDVKAGLVNKGELKVNRDEEGIIPPEPEDVTLTGVVFEDLDGDGLWDAGKDEGIERIDVVLYKNGDHTKAYRTTVTDDDGYYEFKEVEADGSSYEVSFPKHIGSEGLVPERAVTYPRASHALRTSGLTTPVKLQADQILNAGYAAPDISTVSPSKKVKAGDGDYASSIIITDLEQVLEYRISFTLPENMNGYYYLEVQDQLPKELCLPTNEPEQHVSILVRAPKSEKLRPMEELFPDAGTLDYNEKTGLVTYIFDKDFALDQLAGYEIYMELSTVIASERVDEVNGEIRNEGKLIINKNEDNEDDEVKVEPKEPPVVNPGGIVGGYVWEDANKDGVQNENLPLAGREVKLEKWSGGKWVETKYTTLTDSKGEYAFTVGAGTYRVKFPWMPESGITKKWADGARSYAESHEDSDAYLNRFSDEVQVKAGDIHKVDVGYIKLALPGKDDFKKYLVDEAGNKTESIAVTDPVNEVIKYRIDLKLGDLSGYDTLEIIDELDPRFELQVVELQSGEKKLTAEELEKLGSWTIDKNNKFIYTFQTPLDKSLLEHKTISLYLNVTIRPNVESLENITNIAYYIINGDGGEEGDVGDSDGGDENPNVELEYGYIEGWVWLDKEADNLRDETYKEDESIKGAAITLYRWDGSDWKQQGEPVYTDEQGHYIFMSIVDDKEQWRAFPYGRYRIAVSHNEQNMEYVTKWKDNIKFDGIRSDVESDGAAAFELNKNNQYPKPSAGLREKENEGGNNNGEGTNPPGGNEGGGDDNNNGGGTNPPRGNEGGDNNNGNGNGNGGSEGNGGNNGNGNGNNTKDEENEFKKMPLDKVIYPGKTVDYAVSGFGNAQNKALNKYSITDILPEGLHFDSAKIPAFTNGVGVTYDVTYITNKSGRRSLHSDVPADKAFKVKSPELESGEYIMYLTIKMKSVPIGFGIGDTIVFTCRVDEKPPTLNLVNQATLGYEGMEISAETQSLQIGEAPKTGDKNRIWLLVLLFILGGITAAVLYVKHKKLQMIR